MAKFDKNAFFNAVGIGEVTTFDVKGFGPVHIKPLSISARERLEKTVLSEQDEEASFSAAIIAHTVCDEDGKLVFTPSDIKTLGESHSGALTPLLAEVQKVCGIQSDDVEEAEKN